jgi:hypothetical protein
VRPVVVRSYLTLFEADVAWSAIDAADIHAALADDNLIRLNFLLSNAIGGVKLVVPSPLVDEVRAILDERARPVAGDEAEFPHLPDEEKCKSCGGDAFEFHERMLMPVATWLLLGFPLGRIKRIRQCRRCGAVP